MTICVDTNVCFTLLLGILISAMWLRTDIELSKCYVAYFFFFLLDTTYVALWE
jgi:hypothetical protein